MLRLTRYYAGGLTAQGLRPARRSCRRLLGRRSPAVGGNLCVKFSGTVLRAWRRRATHARDVGKILAGAPGWRLLTPVRDHAAAGNEQCCPAALGTAVAGFDALPAGAMRGASRSAGASRKARDGRARARRRAARVNSQAPRQRACVTARCAARGARRRGPFKRDGPEGRVATPRRCEATRYGRR